MVVCIFMTCTCVVSPCLCLTVTLPKEEINLCLCCGISSLSACFRYVKDNFPEQNHCTHLGRKSTCFAKGFVELSLREGTAEIPGIQRQLETKDWQQVYVPNTEVNVPVGIWEGRQQASCTWQICLSLRTLQKVQQRWNERENGFWNPL